MKVMSCEIFDDEIYDCPYCETTDYTDDWRCPHCGGYIRIKATIVYADTNFCNDIYFIRKTIDEVEIGDIIIMHNSFIYEVLNKVESYSQKKHGCSYRLALKGFGFKAFSDYAYYNCIYRC